MDAEFPNMGTSRKSRQEGTGDTGPNGHDPGAQGNGEAKEEKADGLPYRRLPPIGAANIPPRQWAYGKFLLFGSVAVIGAVDGAGKGVIAVGIILAQITGEPLLGERVWRKGPVAIVTYEDDEEEWHRRIAVACLKYNLDYVKILESVYFIHKHDETKVSFGSGNGGGMAFPDSAGMIKTLNNLGIVLLVIDPFNHAHDGDDGNNNVMIAKVAAEVARIARATKVAVMVLHHLRKGSSGQPDDLMGALSLRATFRSCRILMRMTEEAAAQMKITDGAWRYIRIAGSKENYTPPPDKSTWYKLESIPLGNTGDETYPEGDDMGVATTWQARPMFEGMDATALRAVFSALRDSDHGPNKQAKNTPWAGKALMERGGRSEAEAGKIIKTWIESGTLTKGEYYHKASKHTVEKVVLNDAKAAEILAELDVSSAAPD
jgi:AAA domain